MKNKINVLKALLLVNFLITAYIINFNNNLQKSLESIQTNLSNSEKTQKDMSSIKPNVADVDLANIINTKVDESTLQLLQAQTFSTIVLGITLFATITFFFYLNATYLESTHIQTISTMEKCCNTELKAIDLANQNNINLLNLGAKKLDLMSSIHETQLSNVETNIITTLNQKFPESLDQVNQVITTVCNN